MTKSIFSPGTNGTGGTGGTSGTGGTQKHYIFNTILLPKRDVWDVWDGWDKWDAWDIKTVKNQVIYAKCNEFLTKTGRLGHANKGLFGYFLRVFYVKTGRLGRLGHTMCQKQIFIIYAVFWQFLSPLFFAIKKMGGSTPRGVPTVPRVPKMAILRLKRL